MHTVGFVGIYLIYLVEGRSGVISILFYIMYSSKMKLFIRSSSV